MAKRITSSAVNWSFIMDTLPAAEVSRLTTLKTTFDKYLREISSKPVDLPKIDWNFYKSKISTPGMVDSFQKSYESLKIPYPSDQGVLADTEKYNSELIKFASNTYEGVLQKVKDLKEELKNLETLMKYSEMTVEEYFLARPDKRIDTDNPRIPPYFVDFDEKVEEDKK